MTVIEKLHICNIRMMYRCYSNKLNCIKNLYALKYCNYNANFYPFFTVPTPTISITPSGPIQGAMVGSPQDIQCTVSTVSGVEFSSVLISWMGPGGDTITNDSRVMISPTSGSGNNYTSSFQFMYLMEGDEGTYECSVMILETNGSVSVELNSLIGELIFCAY